jgi:hypothetical protein
MRVYDGEDAMARIMAIALYLPVLFGRLAERGMLIGESYRLMMKLARRPPIALPITDGIKWAPASVSVACAETWKYIGTSSII